MNPILDIVASGGVRALAGLAAEAVGIVPRVPRSGGRSLASLGIATIRRQFPLLTKGQAGYEVARNVWRRALRSAESARRRNDREPPAPGDAGGGGPSRPRPRPGARMGEYVYRVEFVSRAGVSRWRTLTFTGPAGLSDDALRARADAVRSDGPDVSPGQRYRPDFVAASSRAETVVVLSFRPLSE